MEKVKQLQQDILTKIEEYERIIILRHVRPDPDAIGSQVGLAELIRHRFPEKKVYTNGEEVKNLTELIAPMTPAPVEEISGALVIVCDTANLARLDGDSVWLDQSDFVIKIDHHPNVESYGDLEWVDPSYSSTCEMLADLWHDHQESLPMTAEAARFLYTGMTGDTNRFLYESTTPRTMHLAAELMTFDFDHAAVHFKMAEMSSNVARLMAYVLENLTITVHGAGAVVLKRETLKKLQVTEEETHAIVSLPGNIAGVELWGVFVEQADGTYRCRLRSKAVPVQPIAARHAGGGHLLASGATAADYEEVEVIINELDEASGSAR